MVAKKSGLVIKYALWHNLSMELGEYRKMEDFEQQYWWHRGKIHLIRAFYDFFIPYEIKEKEMNIIEIGCGTGEVLRLLAHWGDVKGVDFSQEALDACRRKGFKDLICGDVNEIDFNNEKSSYDLVVLMDVLEHIQDDMKTLNIAKQLLKPGGFLFLSVPAYKFLWSTHDEALHHKRRYHSLEIKTKVKDSGFEIVKYSHYVTLLFFPIALFRLLSNFVRRKAYPKTHYVPLPTKLNDLFTKFLLWEARLLKSIYLPVGTTLVLVAKK
jgi:2-polyprenyl-3-methyl-5-hydroxy-6-metoxy-1,4-benzoquinol methylase